MVSEAQSNLVHCSNCGSDLYRSPYDRKRLQNFYCDLNCQVEHRKKIGFFKTENHPSFKGGLVKTTCGYCNEEIEVKPYRLRNKTGKVFCSNKCLGKWLSKKKGNKSYNWKGGLNDLQNTIRKSTEMKAFVLSIYERDGFTCKKCNKGSNKLNVHHIKSVSKILRENSITTIQEAINCKELWDIENTVTLCKECHEEFHLIYGRSANTFKEEDYYEWINNIKIAV